MDDAPNLELELDEEARYFEAHSEFTFEDALESLRRSLKYFIDSGQDRTAAWQSARELVSVAVMSAARNDFGLVGMVEHMLLGFHHRVQSSRGFQM